MVDIENKPKLSDLFINNQVLNIFTDASISGKNACAGAIAVCDDIIIDKSFRICNDATNNYGEAKAVLLGIYLASKYKKQFKCINIFSDSQITIYGIRDRYVNWLCKDNVLYTKTGGPVANQELYIEMVKIINMYSLHINFFNQKGHVNQNNFSSIKEATVMFRRANNIKWDEVTVDYGFIRYISKYNDIVDVETGRMFRHINDNRYGYLNKINPFKFIPINNGQQIELLKKNKGELPWKNQKN